MNSGILALQRALPRLSSSERRVADAVLARPLVVVESTISQLASLCNTSPGTVARLCRAAGFSGYKDFRIAVGTAHAYADPAEGVFRVSDAEIAASDSLADVVAKVASQQVRAIENTARAVDLDALDIVASALRDAPRVDVFGIGSSGLAASDLHIKLHRLGIPSVHWTDTHLALTSVAVTRPGAVAIAVSHTGQTHEAVEFLALAERQGARTVAITNAPHSPLGRAAELLLATVAEEDVFRAGAMSSRLAQMAIIDFLYVRLVQGDVAGTDVMLRATRAAVEGHRAP
ncbi:MurR/RpiR family transcriptional regulator [Microbacterium keratanolyticum]|uniref:MurR/RpiR family transcriptional regulator n=1 Tax=Microbacterium keratanolyticum TaxID=67574 RepID=UPI0036406E26